MKSFARPTIATLPVGVTIGAGAASAVFCATITVAAIAGAVVTPRSDTAHALAIGGHEWAVLLRGMAVLKTLMAAAATAAVLWRLRSSLSLARLALYGAAAAAMVAGPGLIWGLDHIAFGALLLHAGLAATLLLLWRDPQVAARLAALVAMKRRRRMSLSVSAGVATQASPAPPIPAA